MGAVLYQGATLTGAARHVKVKLRKEFTGPYKEMFKGKEVTVDHDGISMPILEANRFLSKVVAPPDQRPDGTYEYVPKALYIEEFTDEEMAQKTGLTTKDIEKEKKEEAKLLLCSVCGNSFKDKPGLKRHITINHSELAATMKEEPEGDTH